MNLENVIVKKSRGRPKKDNNLLASDSNKTLAFENEHFSEHTVGKHNEEKAKKRGRPKKIFSDINKESNHESHLNQEKINLINVKPDIESIIVDEKIINEEKINLQKKRGRPKKIKPENIVNTQMEPFLVEDTQVLTSTIVEKQNNAKVEPISAEFEFVNEAVENKSIENDYKEEKIKSLPSPISLKKESFDIPLEKNKELPKNNNVWEGTEVHAKYYEPLNYYQPEIKPLSKVKHPKKIKIKTDDNLGSSIILLFLSFICLCGSVLFLIYEAQPNFFELSPIEQKQSLNSISKQSLKYTIDIYNEFSDKSSEIAANTTNEIKKQIKFLKDPETPSQIPAPIVSQKSETDIVSDVQSFPRAIDGKPILNFANGTLDFAWNGGVLSQETINILNQLKEKMENRKLQIFVYPVKENQENNEMIDLLGRQLSNQLINLGFKKENLTVVSPAFYMDKNPNILDVNIIHLIWN